MSKYKNSLNTSTLLLCALLVACHNGSDNNANTPQKTELKTTLNQPHLVKDRPGFAHAITESEVDALIASQDGKKLTKLQAKALADIEESVPILPFKSVRGGLVANPTFPATLGAAAFQINNDANNRIAVIIGQSKGALPVSFLDPSQFEIASGNKQGGLTMSFSKQRAFESELFGVTAGASVSAYGASVSSQVSYLTQTQSTDDSLTITASASEYKTTSIKPITNSENNANATALGKLLYASDLCNNTKLKFTKWSGKKSNTCARDTIEWPVTGDNTSLPYEVLAGLWDKTGDAYISSVKQGYLFVTSIQLQFNDKQSKKNFETSFNAAYDGAATKANVFADIKQAMDKSKTKFTMNVSTYQWGGEPLFTAHAIRHISTCDLSTDSGPAECQKLLDDINDYVSDNTSYGLTYQAHHPELYQAYNFPAVSNINPYDDSSLTMTANWTDDERGKVSANLAMFYNGTALADDPKKREHLGSIWEVAKRTNDYVAKQVNRQYSISGYANNSSTQIRLWGSNTAYNEDKNHINDFMNGYVNIVSPLKVVNESGQNISFKSGLRDMINYPSSYAVKTTSSPAIELLYAGQLLKDLQESKYGINEKVLDAFEDNSYALGHSDEQYAKNLPNFYLLPAEVTKNDTLRHYILVSTPFSGGIGGTDIPADQFGSTDIYLRKRVIDGKPGTEVFGKIEYARDNSLNYQPYKISPISFGSDATVKWSTTTCATWGSNPIYIMPGSRIRFNVQSTKANTSNDNKNSNIPGDYYKDIGQNMFPICAGGFSDTNLRCNDRAFFAYYAYPINTNGNDACMRSLIKMQDIFRKINKVESGTGI